MKYTIYVIGVYMYLKKDTKKMGAIYHVEMYRDTTDRRIIQKKTGAMQEKNGRSDQPFTKQNQTKRRREGRQRNKRPTRTTAEQETYMEVRKKQRKCTS